MGSVCDRWPYPCDSPILVNPEFNVIFGLVWIAVLVWSLNGNSGRVSEYGAKIPLTEKQRQLRNSVAIITLLSPVAIQIVSCVMR